MELKQKTFSGMKWIFTLNIVQKVLSFCTTIILARLLVPEDFGLFALSFVLIESLGLFKSLGVDQALIRWKDESSFKKAANTAFILIPLFGLFLFALLYVIAPLGAKLLGNVALTNIVRVLGLFFVIGCFGRVPDAILNRNMQFRQKSIAEIVANFTYSACAVILAFIGFGVWSLVIAYVIKVGMLVSCYWYFAKWRFKLEFDKKIALEMFHFGKYIVASYLILFIRSNLDKILIGRLLGVAQLGFYFLAFNLTNFTTTYLIMRLSRVLFPAFSKMQHDKEYFAEAYLRVVKYIALIALPFGIGLFLVGGDFLKIAYGDKWMPAIGVLKILAIAGIFQALVSSVRPALLAAGKSKLQFYLNLLHMSIFFVLVIPATYYFGILGTGYAVLCSAVLSFIIYFWRTRIILNFQYLDLFRSLKPAIASSVFMVLIIQFIKLNVFRAGLNNVFSLVVTILAAMLVYGSCVVLLDMPTIKEFKQLVFKK